MEAVENIVKASKEQKTKEVESLDQESRKPWSESIGEAFMKDLQAGSGSVCRQEVLCTMWLLGSGVLS